MRRYLLQTPGPGPAQPGAQPEPADAAATLDGVFDVITHRRFCALSRGRARRYRAATLEAMSASFRRGEPLEFWFDIGPGYRASLRPGMLPLQFDVGLGEFLLLRQVAAFVHAVSRLYAPGARFRLVLDNLCALRTNDIPVERTAGYCARLRRLIDDVGLGPHVLLFVESEQFDLREYDARLQRVDTPLPVGAASPAEIENVARFLGRRCGPAEAAERIRQYVRATAATEQLMGEVVRGVRLTQRATPATLGFRSFPGGDARMQCGEIALQRGSDGNLSALLLTSRNTDFYECSRVRPAGVLPASIAQITIASRRD